MVDRLLLVVYLAAGLLVALVVHEYAHALVAVRLGDLTPKLDGRLTLDPRPHVEVFGTLILPGLLLLPVLFGGWNPLVFAYAKPQRQNPWGVRGLDRHATVVALAGPAANVVLALAFGALARLAGTGQAATLLEAFLVVNVVMAAMNLVPIPPLDMTRVVARYLPPRAREVLSNLEQYGALFMLAIFFLIPGPIFAFVRVVGNGICRAVAGGPCLP
jgi:Zn-dependent protease